MFMDILNTNSLCPSYRNIEGAKLLGVRLEDGTISILPKPMEINPVDFMNNLPAEVNAEQAFRFTGTCQQEHCRQWTKKGCGIALRISRHLDEIDKDSRIPDCSLRKDCRWYRQEGIHICKICPYVITDLTADEIDNHFYSISVFSKIDEKNER